MSDTLVRQTEPRLVKALSVTACLGCAAFIASILVADFVVPDHDWVADTISDLGAGRYEFIVDTGIYAFSAALVATALLAAHIHPGGGGWSVGVVGLALLGLIVFLVGARNEYGDNDSEGVVIHVYLVYALGLLFVVVPLGLFRKAAGLSAEHGRALIALAALWLVSAPVFFLLPTGIDGIYERYLGMIAIAMVVTLAHLFHGIGQRLEPS